MNISKRRQKLIDAAVSACKVSHTACTTKMNSKIHDKAVDAVFAVLGDGIHNDDKPEFLEMIRDQSQTPLTWEKTDYGDWKLTIDGIKTWYRV